MSTTTTDRILNNEAVDCSGFTWSDRIEYKPLPPNGGMLIRTREPITPEYEFTISKDAIAPTCPNEPIISPFRKVNEELRTVDVGRLLPRRRSTTEKEENKTTRRHALITFKNGNNILCPVSENGNVLRYDRAELIANGISESKFREEMKKTNYSLKREMRYKPVICPVCKGKIMATVNSSWRQDDVHYYKCQRCGRGTEEIEATLVRCLNGDLAALSWVVEFNIGGFTILKYSENQELKNKLGDWLKYNPCIFLDGKILTVSDVIEKKMKDEWLDGISPARILRDTLKEMEATDQMFRNSIIEIKEIVPNKVYEYRFVDGDIQKTVCSDSDQFSMEDSITIAYAKHFMGGSGRYNRAVDKAMKLFANQKAAEEKAKKEKEDAEARRAKKAKKRAERLARKREAELEEKIAIQAEAYRRAMQSMAEERHNKKFEKHKKPKEA